MKSLIFTYFLLFSFIFISSGCFNSTPGVQVEEISFRGIEVSIEENLSVGTTLSGQLYIQNAPPNLSDVVITLSGEGAEDFQVAVSQGSTPGVYVGSVTLSNSLEGKGGSDYNLIATATLNGQSITAPVHIRILAVERPNTPPVARIDAQEEEVFLTLYEGQQRSVFADYSTDADDGIVSCKWEDNTSQILSQHRFNPAVPEINTIECQLDLNDLTAGEYTYTLTVEDQSGATDTNLLHVTVNANAIPTVTIEEGNQTVEANTTLTLHAVAEDGDGDDLQYQWMYGLKESTSRTGGGTTESFEHNFTQPGIYIVSVTVHDIHDAFASDSVKVTVTGHINQPPVAKIGFATEAGTEREQNITTAVGVQVLRLISDGSYDPDGEIVHCEWKDHANRLIQESNDKYCGLNQYIFDDPGTYEYTLTVTDNEGASDTNVAHITVEPNAIPVAKIEDGNRTVDVNTTVHFVASASDDDGEQLTYFWRYGKIGTYGIAATPMTIYPDTEVSFDHNFTQTGRYFVEFLVSDAKGAFTKAQVEVNITRPLPQDVVIVGDLMWEDTDHVKGSENFVTWSEAYTYCDTLTLGGYRDWRLPHSESDGDNINSELTTIRIKTTDANDNSLIDGFKPIYQSEYVISWTDAQLGSGYHAAHLFIGNPDFEDGFGDNENGINVRCVRTITTE